MLKILKKLQFVFAITFVISLFSGWVYSSDFDLEIDYLETITVEAEGEGKFIRLSGGKGDYGHVVLRIEPKERGSGVEFSNAIIRGVIPDQYLPVIEKSIIGFLSTSGILANYPVDDIKVTVFDGSFHETDSNEESFKIAAKMALKETISKANPVLLEPIMMVDVTGFSQENTGQIAGSLNRIRGQIEGMSAEKIQALVPLASMLGYSDTLNQLTDGKASYIMKPSHYEEVPRNIAEKITSARRK